MEIFITILVFSVHQKNKKGTQLKNYFIRFKFYSKYNNVDRKINISKWFI